MSAKVLELNNTGILLLKQQETETAIAHFMAAIKSFRRLSTTKIHRVGNHEYPSQGRACGKESFITTMALENSRDSAVSPHNLFHVYDRAFVFEPMFDLQSNTVLCASTLLYNLAFAYHLLAMTRLEDSTKNMKVALKCYKQGINVIRNSLQCRGHEQLFLLSLPYLNNMGQIYAHVFRMDEAKDCRERIDVLLASLAQAFPLDGNIDFDFFYSGMFHNDRSYYSITVAPSA